MECRATLCASMQVAYAHLAELMTTLKKELSPKAAEFKEPKEYKSGPSFAEFKVMYGEALCQAGLA